MKTFKKILSGMMAFFMVFALTAVAAPAQEAKAENETLTAYLAYSDGAWGDAQYWGEDAETLATTTYPNVKVTTAEIADWGQYTVGLDFTGTTNGAALGTAFSAVIITNGDVARPGAIITVDEVKINGEVVEMGEGYTSSDDGIETRYNLFNEWVSAIPEDARNASGDLSKATATSLSKDLCAEVKTIEVTFTYAPGVTAFIDYANSDWSTQIWTGASDNGITAVMPEITGEGTYTTSLDFTGTANGYVDGVAFAALMMSRGELVYPNYSMRLEAVEINGEAVDFGKYYTTSDDGISTRINLYNEWCGHAADGTVDASTIGFARRADGNMSGVTPLPVSKDLFNGVETLSVTFSLVPTGADKYIPTAEWPTTAYLAYADGAWGDAQYWGEDAAALATTAYPNVKVTTAEVTGYGQYTVGLDFTGTANGKAAGASAFASLMVKNLEQIAPGACLTIDKVEVNGAEVTIGTPYTSSDDGIETRSNLYNTWVSALPADARTAAGSLDGATWTPMTAEQLTDVETMYVTFTISPVMTASINYVNSDWSVAYWGEDPAVAAQSGIVVNNPAINAPGTYTASIDFTGTANGAVDGVSFAALMLNRGEASYDYPILTVDEIKVNGEAIEFKPGYATYDNDGSMQTRVNLWNDWVTIDAETGMLTNDESRPEDVRTADGSTDVTPKMLDAATMNGVKTVEVTFTLSLGKAPVEEVVEKVVYTADKSGVYNAYLWFQTDNYTFRNTQSDASYGKESNPEAFGQVSYVEDSVTVKKEGVLHDVEIKGNGTYKVGVTEFTAPSSTEGAAPFFRILGFSTNIPADESIVFSDVKIKMDGKTVYTFDKAFMDPDDGNRGLHSVLAINEYNKNITADHEFGYNFPASEVWIEFTVSGFDYDLVAEGTTTAPVETPAPVEPTAAPTEAPAEPTAAPTEAPAATTPVPTTAPADVDTDAEGGMNPIVIVVIVVAVIAIAGVAAFVVMKKKK